MPQQLLNQVDVQPSLQPAGRARVPEHVWGDAALIPAVVAISRSDWRSLGGVRLWPLAANSRAPGLVYLLPLLQVLLECMAQGAARM